MPENLKRIFTKISEEEHSPPIPVDTQTLRDDVKVDESPPAEISPVETTESPQMTKIFRRKIFQKIEKVSSSEDLQEEQVGDIEIALSSNISPPEPINIKNVLKISKPVPIISGETYGNFTIKIIRRIRRIDKIERVEI